MSYSELVKELKLENRLMAVTRVHAKDEKVNDIFGCVYKRFERVLNGETLVLKEGSCSCGGFDHNSGLNDEKPKIPVDSAYFCPMVPTSSGRRPAKNSSAIHKRQMLCSSSFLKT
ncbi:MAG: hypothetical protein V8R50_06385 [Clostridia bacterium]